MSSTAFITGASSGFGQACARRFHEDGWRVVLSGRREERLRALAAELGAGRCSIVVLDVRDRAAVEAAVASLDPDFAAVDLLVNNAGLALGLEPAWRADVEQWETMIDTNVKGLAYCARALLPGMVERGRGHVISIGSVAGAWPYPGGNAYGATKAFVAQFANNLRADLVGTPVRVTNVEPGLAETEFSVVRFGGDAEKAAATYRGTEPLRADDIADAVHWAATRPRHVNVNRIEIMPVCQAFGPFAIAREGT